MPANRFNGFTDCGIGIGLRIPHYRHVFENAPAVDWFEIISENYMVDGGIHDFNPYGYLDSVPVERIAQIHPKSAKYILGTHDHPVIDPVWKLTLLELDDPIPLFDQVHEEERKAEVYLDTSMAVAS